MTSSEKKDSVSAQSVGKNPGSLLGVEPPYLSAAKHVLSSSTYPSTLEAESSSTMSQEQPLIRVSNVPTVQEREVVALETQANALAHIAQFLGGTTLPQVLQQIAVTNGMNGMLSGLVSADGRQGLDARTMKQNALEISTVIQETIKKVTSDLIKKTRPLVDGEEVQGFTEQETLKKA